MIPLIGTPAHLILPYENKAGEEDPFDFDDATEQRKWKGVETASLYIDWIIAETDTSAIRCCPGEMNSTHKYSQKISVIESYGDKLIVWEHGCVQENEDSVLGGFHRCYVTGQTY